MENCCICLEKPKLPYQLDCKHQFCYLCLKFAMLSNTLTCPLCRSEVSPDVLEKASLENTSKINNTNSKTKLDIDFEKITNNEIHDKSTKNINKYHWLYSGRQEGYWKYDNMSQTLIESEYRKWLEKEDNIDDDFKPNYKSDEELDKNGYILINVGGVNPFYFNFHKMIQYNHRNGAIRPIKRLSDIEIEENDIFIKGIAGLKC